jgi:hypothetical protein
MKRILYLLFVVVFFYNCSKDEDGTLSPTYKDINWFTIADSDDELDHLRHEIWRDYDISVYYSDTIGRQFRGMDHYGDSIVHYEVLNINYTIEGGDVITETYELSKNREDIKNGILFVKNDVIPLLIPKAYPRSVLLVEYLVLQANKTESEGKREGRIYKGMTTTVIGQIDRLATMSKQERDSLATEVAGVMMAEYIVETYAKELANFYELSNQSVTWPAEWAWEHVIYDRTVLKTGSASSYAPFLPHWNEYGFLNDSPVSNVRQIKDGEITRFRTPSKVQDVAAYLQAVMLYDRATFSALYEGVVGYELIMQKYDIMKEVWSEMKNNAK